MALWEPKNCSCYVLSNKYILHNNVVLDYKLIYFINCWQRNVDASPKNSQIPNLPLHILVHCVWVMLLYLFRTSWLHVTRCCISISACSSSQKWGAVHCGTSFRRVEESSSFICRVKQSHFYFTAWSQLNLHHHHCTRLKFDIFYFLTPLKM
jgi:hypothetical protein